VDVKELKKQGNEYRDIKSVTRSLIFRSVLDDIIYLLGVSIKKTTGVKSRVRLNKIRMTPPYSVDDPMYSDSIIVVGHIQNLIGGKFSCLIDNNLLSFLDNNVHYDVEGLTSLEVFLMDFFDCFSSMGKTDLFDMQLSNFDYTTYFPPDSAYYMSFDISILTRKKMISSKFIVSVDEIISLYF